MEKLRKASKRLSVGSWGPFSSHGEERRGSRTPSTVSVKRSGDFTDGSERPTAVPVVAVSYSYSGGALNGAVQEAEVPPSSNSSSSSSNMVELARIITRESEKLERYLRESGSAMPSLDIDGPANFPKLPDEMQKARAEILRATKELEFLVTGPTEKVRWMAWDVSFFPGCRHGVGGEKEKEKQIKKES